MSRITYVNGRYVPHEEAVVNIEDRGYQFADAVYEVMSILDGKLCHRDKHMSRLDRSLSELKIEWPVSRRVLPIIIGQVVARNHVRNGLVYIQVSRGVAHRNHLFPKDTIPSLVVDCWAQKPPSVEMVASGVAVVSRPDQRWKRPDIKTVALLPNLLARQSAKEDGAFEAWLVNKKGFVTEGCATNAYIVDDHGVIFTHPADSNILGGVTRSNLLEVAHQAGIQIKERPFTLAEARAAREAFLTGTTVTVMPVVRLDGHLVGDGKPGALTLKLREFYHAFRQADSARI